MTFSDDREDLDSLRRELQDAEDVCRALRAGEVDAVVVGLSDEEKRVLLLSGSYTRYRQIVEDMRQGAVTLTGSGEILFANHAFAAMVEEPLGGLFRTPLVERLPAPERPLLKAVLAPASTTREIDTALQARGGREVPVRLSVVSSSDDFVTLLVTDLSAERLLEEAAATLEAIRQGQVDAFVLGGERVAILDNTHGAYKAMVERMRQGAIILSEAGEITYANERFLTLVRVPHGHVIGQPLARFVAAPDQPALRAILEAREAAHGDLALRQSDGANLATQVTMTRLDGQRMLLFTDATERKRHEASDERTRKFLGMLAHEFRNILSPIRASVDYIGRSQPLDEEGKKALATIERQAGRLLALVEDLRRVNPKE